MIEPPVLPDVPEGSAIRVLRGRRGVRIRWPRPGRLSGVVSVSLGGAAVLLLAGAFLAAHGGRKDLVTWLFFPAFVSGAGFSLWYWLGRSGRSTVALEPSRLVFYAPARRRIDEAILRTLRLRATGYAPPDIQNRAEWEAELETQRRRRRNVIARGPEGPVEDLGRLRGVSVGTGPSAIRFGQDLGDADREWLVEVLRCWKDSEA